MSVNERSWMDWLNSFVKSDPNAEIVKLQNEKKVIETDCQKKINDIDIKIQEETNKNASNPPASTISGGGKNRRKTKKGKKSTKTRTMKNYMYNIKWNPLKWTQK